jgi:hypothetical protein
VEIQEMIDMLNSWLRNHTEYKVVIDLCSIYGCVSIELKKGKETMFFNWGETLEKRLIKVLAFITRNNLS